MPKIQYAEVDYKLFLEIAEQQTGRSPQGKGLATKVLGLAREDRIRIDPLNPAPINDTDLLRVYAHHARPEQKDMFPVSQGKATYNILHEYLVRRELLSAEE